MVLAASAVSVSVSLSASVAIAIGRCDDGSVGMADGFGLGWWCERAHSKLIRTLICIGGSGGA